MGRLFVMNSLRTFEVDIMLHFNRQYAEVKPHMFELSALWADFLQPADLTIHKMEIPILSSY